MACSGVAAARRGKSCIEFVDGSDVGARECLAYVCADCGFPPAAREWWRVAVEYGTCM